MTSVKMVGSVSEGPTLAAGFEDLLLEIDRLRTVSDRIEALTFLPPLDPASKSHLFCLIKSPLESEPRMLRPTA